MVQLISLLFAATLFAPSAQGAPTLKRDYRFEGNLLDSRGGTPLKGLGGTVGNGIYTFAAGQGLKLKNIGVKDRYAIEITLRLDAVDGYRKVLDFKKRRSDDGVYVYNGDLVFYNFVEGGSAGVDSLRVFRLERDRATRMVRALIDGILLYEFEDASGAAVFKKKTAYFFVDDEQSGGTEASGGAVTRIRVFDRP